jgi:hypothetical protein
MGIGRCHKQLVLTVEKLDDSRVDQIKDSDGGKFHEFILGI